MSRPRKYRPGAVLTFRQVVNRIERREYIFERGKPQHPSWLGSQSLFLLKQGARAGIYREAVITREWKEKNK